MTHPDWYYFRPGCETCRKSTGFLEENGIEPVNTLSTKDKTYAGDESMDILKQVDELFVMRGRKLVHLDFTAGDSRDEALRLVTGPSGKFRAPALRSGSKLFVGFSKEGYANFLNTR